MRAVNSSSERYCDESVPAVDVLPLGGVPLGDEPDGGGGAGAPTAQPYVLIPPSAALASVQLVSPPPLTQPEAEPQHSLQQVSQFSSEPATMPLP